jgi:hypothetical protein
VVLLAVSLACGGGDATAPPTAPVPTTIELSATTVQLSPGESLQLTATVKDQNGAVLTPLPSGFVITWESSDTTRAAVTAAGVVRGVRPGTASIAARGGSLSSSASATVRSPAAQLEASSATTLAIGPDGGDVVAQSAAGVRYTLNVPAGARPDTVPITLTPIQSLGSAPIAGTVVGGVRLAPSGLEFLRAATLTIELTGDLPAGRSRVVLALEGTSEDVYHLVPAQFTGRTAVVTVGHFSSVVIVDAATLQPEITPNDVTAEHRARHEIALAFNDATTLGGTPSNPNYTDAVLDRIAAAFASWFLPPLRDQLQDAATDQQTSSAVARYALWRAEMTRTVARIGLTHPGRATTLAVLLDVEISGSEPLFRGMLIRAIDRANQQCLGAPDRSQALTAAANALFWQEIAAAHSQANGVLHETAVLQGLCVKVQFTAVTFPSQIEIDDQEILLVRVGLAIGTQSLTDFSVPRLRVDVSAAGATSSGSILYPFHGPTDASGYFETRVVPTGPSVIVTIDACVSADAPSRLIQRVCGTTSLQRAADPAIAVSVTPPSVTLSPGGMQTFSATVTGTSNPAVTWSTTGGSINATTGLYTAPAQPGVYEVRATSVVNTSKYGTSQVTVGSGQIRFIGNTTMSRVVHVAQPHPEADCLKSELMAFPDPIPSSHTIAAETCTFNSRPSNSGTASTTAGQSYSGAQPAVLTMTGTSAANVSGDGSGSANASGQVSFIIGFDVIGSPVSFDLTGNLLSSMTNSQPTSWAGAYLIFHANANVQASFAEYVGRVGVPCTGSAACLTTHPLTRQLNRSGTLAPGRYYLSLYAASEAREWAPPGGTLSGSASYTITFTLRP